MNYTWFLLLLSAFILSLSLDRSVIAQRTPLVVADFNNERNLDNLGGSFGTWDKDPNDKSQGCRMTFERDDALGNRNGLAVRLEYDVDSPNPAYNGFWLKIDNANVPNFDTLTFYLRGDSAKGFTKTIKIEVKDNKGGKDVHLIDGITTDWQKFSIALKSDRPDKSSISEFTVVFDDINSRPKRGVILLDEIELENAVRK